MFGPVMFWTGVATWVALAMIGLFWVIDATAEWFVDSAKFKAYVIGYLYSRRKKVR